MTIEKGKLEMKPKNKNNQSDRIDVFESSGNVFADLGLPDADQKLMKARLTLQIYRIAKKRDLTQREVGEIIGIPQPHVSNLLRNRPGNFSVGRLLTFLTALGQDVEIKLKPARKKAGELSLVLA